jgi:hypothetical protein
LHNTANAEIVYLHNGTTAFYKYGANDRRHQSLRASNLVMWRGIKHCIVKGSKQLNFGRTEINHTGLRQFKQGFGCVEHNVSYYRLQRQAESQFKFVPGNGHETTYFRLITKMPIWMLRIIGNILYRYAAG